MIIKSYFSKSCRYLKVPEGVDRNWSLADLMTACPDLGLVLDLTFTYRYKLYLMTACPDLGIVLDLTFTYRYKLCLMTACPNPGLVLDLTITCRYKLGT